MNQVAVSPSDHQRELPISPCCHSVHVEGSSSLLCLASDMFPPVVQFSWKRQKNNGPLEDLTSEEQLDLRESGRIISILLVQQQKDSSYKYSCSVKHEGGTVEAQTQQGNEGLMTEFNRDSAFLLIVKSLVYCCGLSLLMILRNKGASTNSRHAE
uniref:Ig-like domain-containing protein n=1 Tax=Oryzias latipes TaxID=8090 RepID=H2LQZ8_ORYLA